MHDLHGGSKLDETVGASLSGRPNPAEEGVPTEGHPYRALVRPLIEPDHPRIRPVHPFSLGQSSVLS